MPEISDYRLDRFRVFGTIFLFVSLAGAALAASGPMALSSVDLRDAPFFVLIGSTYLMGLGLLAPRFRFRRSQIDRLFFVTELLVVLGTLLFSFDYIFAANANMDYVQRFIESGGNLRLRLDTRTERAIAAARYLPFVLSALALHLQLAVKLRRYGLLLTLAAVMLTTLSFPSVVSVRGIGVLGWISLVPLIYALWRSRYGKSVFYGVTYGVLATLLSNFWLGTFSLVSLMAVVLIFLGFYGLFMLAFGGVLSALRRRSPGVRILAVAASWTVFELARSSGFLGYPWVLSAHSQYLNPAVMQLAELTGVWGVSFVVVLVNAALAELALAAPSRLRSGGLRLALLAVFALVGLTHLGGAVVLAAENRYPAADEQVRVALVQQNSDPRKHDYEQTFASLRRLSDEALRERPDLIAWSETAFVPNIRRWGEEDPRRYRLARLVREFREYQAGLGTWLLTGNDDYRRVLDEDGMEIERLSYNASVLFSDAGERRETYHKIKLVPFTEHFPFEEELPAVYAALEAFDVHFWEPGRERVVFRHPKFSFATPICFEDVFPNEVRAFVNEGAEVILNLTNDYWSLTEVQARQHFAASIFRSVENRRPLLRSTASGLTAHVDPYGRVVDTRPQYSEQVLLAELSVSNDPPMTLYTRAGDWFPLAAAVLLAGLLVSGLRRRRRRDYGSADSC